MWEELEKVLGVGRRGKLALDSLAHVTIASTVLGVYGTILSDILEGNVKVVAGLICVLLIVYAMFRYILTFHKPPEPPTRLQKLMQKLGLGRKSGEVPPGEGGGGGNLESGVATDHQSK